MNLVRRAAWIVKTDCSDELVIEDVSAGKAMTVTNDVESVVAELYARGYLVHGKRLLYFDSAGDLDEIVHEHGRFVEFRTLTDDERSGRA